MSIRGCLDGRLFSVLFTAEPSVSRNTSVGSGNGPAEEIQQCGFSFLLVKTQFKPWNKDTWSLREDI